MGTSSEVIEYKITTKHWIYLAIFIAVLTSLMVIVSLFTPGEWSGGVINLTASGGTFAAMMGPYAFSIIMLLLFSYMPLEKIRNKQMFALLYVAVMISMWYSGFKGVYTDFAGLSWVRTAAAEVHGYALPSFWMPSADAIKGMYYAGSLGNLFVTYASEWAPVIVTWIYWLVASILYLLGWAVVFRRLWVDIEVLPFPYAQGWLIGETAIQKGPSKFKKYLIIGAVIGLLFYSPYMLYVVYPGLPDFYGWFTLPAQIGGNLYINEIFPAIGKSVAGPVVLATDIMRYALLFLVPLDGLLSMWFGTFLLVMFTPQLLSYFGFYTGIYSKSTGGKIRMIVAGPPLYLDTVAVGMLLGVVVFLFLLNWKYFVETIKHAISDKTQEGETSYRVGYGLIVLGAIGLIALFMVSGVELLDAILGLLVITVLVIGFTRARAYTAVVPREKGVIFLQPFWGSNMPPAPQFPAGKLFISTHVSRWGLGADTWGPYCAPLMGSMDSFKIASMAGVKPKDMFKLLLIGAIVSAVVAFLTIIISLHTFGFMNVLVSKEEDYFGDGDAGTFNGYYGAGIISLPGIIGFLLAGALLYLKIRYIWWPLEPLGFMVGISRYFQSYVGIIAPFVTWIVKYLTIKVGGRKTYDEIALPIALGILAGGSIGVGLIGILGFVRFLLFKSVIF